MESLKELKELAQDLTVLYVEDDSDIAQTIVNYLSKFFKEVIYANNGEKGLALYKDSPCDLVITDIRMPKMNGLDMTYEIKQVNPKQNIVVISAYSEIENFLSSIKLGVDGYVLKPVDYSDFNNLLYKMCNRIITGKEKELYLNRVNTLIEELSLKNYELNHYTDALNKVAIVSKTDLKGYITFVNDFFCDIAGYSREELIGANHNIIRHPDVSKSVFKTMWETIQSGKTWEGPVKNRAKNGTPYYVHATIIPLFEADGQTICEYIGIRFLTTADEMERREFKKKVMMTYQEFKKENYAYKKRIEALEQELLELKSQDRNIQTSSFENKNKHSQLLNQIKFYENEIKKTQDNYNRVLDKTKQSNLQLIDTYKKALASIEKYKQKQSFYEEENIIQNREIEKLQEEVKDQRRIIADLKSTLKSIIEDDNKKQDKGILDKLL